MDFQLVLDTLLKRFDDEGIRYAVIGGFALGFWGVTRSTIDIDLLLLLEDAERAHNLLNELGYERGYSTENVAQYASGDSRYGNIDIIFAFRAISRNMLARAVPVAVSEEFSIKCLMPEDIIGLKIQAMNNDASREAWDRADVEALLSAKVQRNEVIDWQLLEDYFGLFDRADLLRELRDRYETQ